MGLVAPSFGATIEPYSIRLAAAIPRFEARGYKVRCADSVYKSDGLGISTDPRSAAEDVMRFYLDDGIDALLSVGGGELKCRRCRSRFEDPNAFSADTAYADCDSLRCRVGVQSRSMYGNRYLLRMRSTVKGVMRCI